MEIPEQLRCLFTATLEEQDETYRIEIPETELEVGPIQADETYRVAILSSPSRSDSESSRVTPGPPDDDQEPSGPPVAEGDTRTVEIEDIGDQGDGITRVERGFVLSSPTPNKVNGLRSKSLISVRMSPSQPLLNELITDDDTNDRFIG